MASPARGDPPAALLPVERLRVLLPGLYAWLLTLGLPVLARGAPLGARFAAVLALGSLAAGVALAGRHDRLAHGFGIYAFLACAVLGWALLGADLGPLHADRLRAGLGTLGWVLYALGWGRLAPAPNVEAEASLLPGPALTPRSHLHPRSLPVVLFAVAAAVTLEALAFRVDRPEHAVFAHAVAAACAVLVLNAGGRVALVQGTRHELPPGAARLNAVAARAAVLSLLLGIGLVWAALK